MTKEKYKKRLAEINRNYIRVNRRFQDGEIVLRFQKRCVILRATGVYAENGEVTYLLEELDKDDNLTGNKATIYGYEWENVKATGDYWLDPNEDIL